MSDSEVANKFAEKFSSVFYNSATDSSAVSEFLQAYESYRTSSENVYDNVYDYAAMFSVEVIDNCVRGLSLGKACGPDSLSAEHLRYAHPSIMVHLKLLFYFIVTHRIVPDQFGYGIIVPLMKDKSADLNDIDNYRPITLIPILSRVFESVMLTLCEDLLQTSNLQFGFKKGVGCTDAIFAFKTTVGHFVNNGSCVYAAALDVSKACNVL